MQIVQFPDGSSRQRPERRQRESSEQSFVSDEHDQGGFGHTPWGVGIQNRFARPFVPNPDDLPIFERPHGRPRTEAVADGSWTKVRRFMMRFLSRH
jgi:hypothetical protein